MMDTNIRQNPQSMAFLLMGRPFIIPGTMKVTREQKYTTREEAFKRMQAIASAMQRNRKIANRNKVLDVILRNPEGMTADEIAVVVELGRDYTRRLCQDLEGIGLVKSNKSIGRAGRKWVPDGR